MVAISAEPSSSSLRPVRLPAHRTAMEWLGAESAIEKASCMSKGQDSSTRAPSVMSALGSSSAADDVSTVLGSVDFRDLPKIQEGQATEIGSHMDGTQAQCESSEDSGKDTEYSKTSTRMSKSRPAAARSSGRKAKKLQKTSERVESRGGTWEDQKNTVVVMLHRVVRRRMLT